MNQNHDFSVLVAEDEPIILNNIVKKVEKSCPGIQIAGKVQSGKDALSILRNIPVDILITDIEMPGMSGLELIRRVKSAFPQVHVIILSGYSNFEYARTALRYGVEDYLLKPVEQTVLAKLLHTLCGQIEQERIQSSRKILSLVLNGSVDSDASGTSPCLSDALPYLFDTGGFILFYITLGNLPLGFEETQTITNKTFLDIWQKINFEHCFNNTDLIKHLWLIDDHSQIQKFLILHLSEFHRPPEYFLLILKNFLTDIVSEMPFLVLAYKNMIPYQELWHKANLLRSLVKSCARPFSQVSLAVSDFDSFPTGDTGGLIKDMNLLFSLNSEAQFLRCIQETLPSSFQYPPKVLTQCIQFIYDAMTAVFQIDSLECSSASAAFFSRLPSMSTADSMFTCLEASLQELWKNAGSRITNSTFCVRLAQYIEVNYTRQISLPELSAKFGYTASYINRIFKKEYGVSPLQYLTRLKISRAKEILQKSPDINIKSVAQSVGYDDARYFSRIFKSETGMTPSAWAEENIK